MRGAPAGSFSVGLEHAVAPSRSLAKFLREHFALERDDVILCSVSSRHSAAASTSIQDVVLFRGADGVHAGHVWAHVVVKGVTLTLVQTLLPIEQDLAEGTACWRIDDDYEFIETRTIMDAVTWCSLGGDVIRTIVPRDSHM